MYSYTKIMYKSTITRRAWNRQLQQYLVNYSYGNLAYIKLYDLK